MSKPVLLDTNLAVLLAVGLTKPGYIEKHKRLRQFDIEAYKLLADLIGSASEVLFCPNVLSETSNLIRYIDDPIRSEVARMLAYLIGRTKELSVASREAVGRPEYVKLGLTDVVLIELASTGAVLLTDDNQLYLAAISAGLDAINFAHAREAAGQF